MPLQDRLEEDVKEAMKKGQAFRLSTLRMLLSSIHNKTIEKRKKETGLSEDEVTDVLISEAKKRRDAAAEFEKGDRVDLKEKEEQELIIIQEYLPQALSKEELGKLIETSIKESGAMSIKELGQIMRVLQPKVKGRADNKEVIELVKEKLGG